MVFVLEMIKQHSFMSPSFFRSIFVSFSFSFSLSLSLSLSLSPLFCSLVPSLWTSCSRPLSFRLRLTHSNILCLIRCLALSLTHSLIHTHTHTHRSISASRAEGATFLFDRGLMGLSVSSGQLPTCLISFFTHTHTHTHPAIKLLYYSVTFPASIVHSGTNVIIAHQSPDTYFIVFVCVCGVCVCMRRCVCVCS